MTKDTSKFSIEPNCLRVEKPWGFELILCSSDSKITSKIFHVDSGKKLSLQYHDEKEEIMTLLSGRANIHLEDNQEEVRVIEMELRKGYHVTPFQTHRIEALTDCEIMESSTPETGNTVRLEDDYKRDTETEESRSKRDSTKIYMG